MTLLIIPLFSVVSRLGLSWGFDLAEPYQSIKIYSTFLDHSKHLFGVPEGSILGTSFSLFTTPFSLVIGKHTGNEFPFYADDTEVYVHFSQKNISAAFEQFKQVM